ncbi:MAG TPA: GDSL-type esterase/lipase family protein [Sphingobium sp.]
MHSSSGRRRICVIGLAVGALVLAYAAGFASAYQMGFIYRNTIRVVRWVIPFEPDNDVIWRVQSQLFREQPLDGDVTFLGDSLIAFGDWRMLLPGHSIQKRGIAGETTRGVLERLERGEKTLPVVVVMIGVNDPIQGIPLAQTKDNLKAIIQKLHGRRIILLSTLLTRFDYTNAAVAEMDRYEAEICSTGACRFVDLNKTMSKDNRISPDMVTDGIHLGWRGYRAWAAQMKPVLAQ